MVTEPLQLVQPANECTICSRKFHAGDRALVVVRIPKGDYDTICLEDWAMFLAGANVGLSQDRTFTRSGLISLLEEALEAFYEQDDLIDHPFPRP